nr:TIGR01906 family membrane protein [Clostridia bacterium]
MKKRILGRGLAISLALAFSLTMLAAAIYIPATANWVMLPLMEHYAPTEDTHLPAGEYPSVVNMITSYLRGETDTFQHIFTVDSAEYTAFNQKEQHHMADVQRLFRLCSSFSLGSALMTVVIWCSTRRDSAFWQGVRRAIFCALALISCLVLLACIDFDSLFILFHRIAFRNDLWLLNPQTDLLIRLMPIEFFVSYAAIIGGLWLTGMVGLLAYSTHRIKKTTPRE